MSAVDSRVPALDLEAVEAPALERKASFSKKMSKKIRASGARQPRRAPALPC